MTAFSGVNIRTGPAYWELSGPSIMTRHGVSCRACRKPVYKGGSVYCRDGRKLRFFYHEECFRGTADPRTQDGSSFNDEKMKHYHEPNAPDVSGLEKNLTVFQPEAPKELGAGKWSVATRGYQPTMASMSSLPVGVAIQKGAAASKGPAQQIGTKKKKKKRLTLLERQQKLLEESGFSRPKGGGGAAKTAAAAAAAPSSRARRGVRGVGAKTKKNMAATARRR